ncbi:MAG: TonB-dependent receptor [Gammaproteobacteria bacterium]|nr:TonB-dependent receptor [Gammaproteobacteria bacterium]
MTSVAVSIPGALALALAAAPPAAAGPQPPAPPATEEIVVTADPLGSSEHHIVQPVDVLGAEELMHRDPRSIGETVAREPGVTSADFGPGVGRPVIRGLSGARVRVLEDGIGTMDVSSISPDHAVAAEPVFARQVEIYRGPATLLYGSGASGGLVNIVTRRLLDYVPESLEGGVYGHHDSGSDGWQGAIDLSAGAGDFAFHIDGMKRSTGDYEIPGAGSTVPDPGERRGTLANSDGDGENLTGGISWVGSRGFLGFALGTLDNNYGIPGDHGDEAGTRIEQQQTRVDIAAGLEDPVPGIRAVRTRWGHNDHEHAELESTGAIGTRLLNDEWEGRAVARLEAIAGWEIALGMQYGHRDLHAAGDEAFIPATRVESAGGFALGKRDWRQWHFELGGRFENQATDTVTGLQSNHDVYSVSGGAHWEFHPEYELSFALTRAQRAPAIEELYAFGPHAATSTFEVGDAGLGDETSDNLDFAFARSRGSWTWSVSLFYNRIGNFVYEQETDLNGDGLADHVNPDFDGSPAAVLAPGNEGAPLLVRYLQADAEFYGGELQSVIKLIDDHRGHLDLRVWMDYVRGQLAGGGNLPRLPPLRFSAGLDWRRGPWRTGIDYIRVSAQHDTAALETRTGGYNALDMNASYTFEREIARWTVFARASNLLDEEARRHVSFLKSRAPLPGRSILVGLRADF